MYISLCFYFSFNKIKCGKGISDCGKLLAIRTWEITKNLYFKLKYRSMQWCCVKYSMYILLHKHTILLHFSYHSVYLLQNKMTHIEVTYNKAFVQAASVQVHRSILILTTRYMKYFDLINMITQDPCWCILRLLNTK